MLGSVRGVRECFTTQLMVLAQEGFFSSVAAVVDFQVFKTGKTALTSNSLSIRNLLLSFFLLRKSAHLATERFLPSMNSDMSEKLVLCIEWFPPSRTRLKKTEIKTMTPLLVTMTYPPVAGIFFTAFLVLNMLGVDMLH